MLSPRALFLAFPAVLVVVGALLVSQSSEWPPAHWSASRDHNDSELAIDLSVDDENRLQTIRDKQLMALELLNARCTLTEAADRFLELNLKNQVATDNLRFAWQGRSDWERSLRQAAAFARSLSRRDPGRFDEVMIRIEDEAESLLQSEPVIR